ncbi:MAG TPA: glycosyltransferase family 9 protein [Patescibacteria group bacterium]|nr:glycosyltransferase family 9 protein [Patescibacteria group bacterium]
MEIKKIFVSKQAGIGDVVLATPILAGLKNCFPRAHLTLMTFPNAVEAVSGLPFIDEVLVYDKKKDSAWKVLRAMSGSDLALLLDLQYRPALLAWMARVPLRVGLTHKRRCWLNQPVDWDESMDHTYEPYVFADILRRGTGIKLSGADLDTLHFAPAADTERRQVDAMLAAAGIGPHDVYLACSPVTAYFLKDWPLDRWQQLFTRLWECDGLKTVLFGGPSPAKIENSPGLVDLRGRTNLRQAGYLVEKAGLLVNSCSLPVHMAAAFRTPAVVLYGFGDPQRWAPRSHCTVISAGLPCSPCDGYRGTQCTDPRCMQKITVDEVYAACKKTLER